MMTNDCEIVGNVNFDSQGRAIQPVNSQEAFLCISMGMLQIGALSLVGRLVEAHGSLTEGFLPINDYIK